MPKLVLFDIDGTLVLTGGAGIRAMNRACEEVIGHGDALDGIPVAGRTDWIILHDALGAIGHALDEDLFARLRDAYVTHLREEIAEPGEGVKAVMPGVARCSTRSRARRRLPRPAHRQLRAKARASSWSTSICGATSAAARLATMRRIGMRWCRSRSSGRGRAGSRRLPPEDDLRRRRHAARCRVRAGRRCRSRRRRDRDVQRRSTARERRRDRVRGPQRHGARSCA